MRILLVEDNRRLSDSLRMILQEDGYAVDTAYDGPEGEEAGMPSRSRSGLGGDADHGRSPWV